MKTIFVPLSLKTTRINPSPPLMDHSKKKFLILILSITNNEIVQNSKSKQNKFSFVCTFKLLKYLASHHYKRCGKPVTRKYLASRADEGEIEAHWRSKYHVLIPKSSIAKKTSKTYIICQNFSVNMIQRLRQP